MPRKSKTDQELGYIRSWWMECNALQHDYGVALNMFVHPSTRAGVFVFRMVATRLMRQGEESVGDHAIQFEFPNGTLQSLSGALWAYSMKLMEMVAEDADKRTASRKRGG